MIDLSLLLRSLFMVMGTLTVIIVVLTIILAAISSSEHKKQKLRQEQEITELKRSLESMSELQLKVWYSSYKKGRFGKYHNYEVRKVITDELRKRKIYSYPIPQK